VACRFAARDRWICALRPVIFSLAAAARPGEGCSGSLAWCEDLVVAYCLTFFCRSSEESGPSALSRFLAELTRTGDPVLIRRTTADYADEVDACELATDNGSGTPTAGWVLLGLSAGVRYNAQSVIAASPDDEHGIWGSDLQAQLILSGVSTDWPLVKRIWAVLVTLWSAIAWDEMSGFEVNKDALGPD